MRQWQFFTPESLSDMTQDDLEHIFGQYIQTMEAFKPINLNDDDDDDDDDNDDDDELWPDDEVLTPNDLQPTLYENISTSSTTVPIIMEYPLHAHSGASLSAELLSQKDLKPLPDRPTATTTSIHTRRISTTLSSEKKQHRKSMAKMRNRLSWTSDTGLLTNSAMGQTWANELMTMFNMEFQVDTNLNLKSAPAPAPTLPELPFSARYNQQKRQSHRKSQRYSTDSFMNLIPAFETFKLEEPTERRSTTTVTRPRSSSQPDAYHHQENTTKSTPTRSSSLKIKSRTGSALAHGSSSPKSKSSTDVFLNGLAKTFGGVATPDEKAPLSKKRSIRRFTALVTGTKSKNHHDEENTNTNNNTNNSKNQQLQQSSSSSSSSSSPPPASAAEATTTPTLEVTYSASTASLSPTTSLNRSSSSSSNVYHTPLSPANSSNPLYSNTSASHLSTSESSSSSHSMLMVATKTSLIQHKPLPDIPSLPSMNDDDDDHKNHQRRTSYSMARPVIVELTDLRRSRSAGYRPKRKRNSFKGKNSEQSRTDEAPSTPTELPKQCESIVNHHSPSLLSTSEQPSLSDPPLPTDTNSTSLLPPPSPSLSTPRPKRSKSTLMRIGSGLSSKGHKLLARKSDLTAANDMQMNTISDGGSNNRNNNFVKRMASFGKRMKLQRV
ncbi:unnamed protein product [Absidia cylindrospora]